MNAILYQLAEKQPLYISLCNTAGKIDRQNILKTGNGTVRSRGKRLSHINIKAFNIWLHSLRDLQSSHVGQACRRILILNLGIELADHQIFNKQRHNTDERIPLGLRVRSDIAPQQLFIQMTLLQIFQRDGI